jgi:hypothetical protein
MRIPRIPLLLLANLLAILLLVEIAAYLYLRATSPGDDFKERIQAGLEAPDPGKPGAGAPVRRVPIWTRDHMLHPYLGFVRDPERPRHVLNGRVVRSELNEHGFFGPSPLAPADEDGPLVVAIFGGSVATELYLEGREALAARLIALRPELGARGVEVLSLALDGMKQPQQLLALAYFLAVGARFDVVVNLDGFNDVVLPMAENVPLGVSPFFPRSWRTYAMGAPGGETARLTTSIQQARAELEERRSFFSRPGLRESHLFLAIWHGVLGRAEAEQSALQEELRQHFANQVVPAARESGPAFDDPTPERVYRASAEVWRRASLQMWQACRAAGIGYLHALQPNQYVEGSKTLTAWEQRNAVAGPRYSYRRGVESGYPHLFSEAEELVARGAPFVDLTRVFETEPETIYRDTCCHTNARGNELLALAIADAIVDLGLLDR